MTRLSIAQIWPDIMVIVPVSSAAAVAIGMSSHRIAADLPPNSSVHRAIRPPQTAPIRLPASVEPVKLTLSTPGLQTR